MFVDLLLGEVACLEVRDQTAGVCVPLRDQTPALGHAGQHLNHLASLSSNFLAHSK